MNKFLTTFNAKTTEEYPFAGFIVFCIAVILVILTFAGAFGGAVLGSVFNTVKSQPATGAALYFAMFAVVSYLTRNSKKTFAKRIADNLATAAFCVIAEVIVCGMGYIYSQIIIWIWQELITKAPLIIVFIGLLTIHSLAYYMSQPAGDDLWYP